MRQTNNIPSQTTCLIIINEKESSWQYSPLRRHRVSVYKSILQHHSIHRILHTTYIYSSTITNETYTTKMHFLTLLAIAPFLATMTHALEPRYDIGNSACIGACADTPHALGCGKPFVIYIPLLLFDTYANSSRWRCTRTRSGVICAVSRMIFSHDATCLCRGWGREQSNYLSLP